MNVKLLLLKSIETRIGCEKMNVNKAFIYIKIEVKEYKAFNYCFIINI